MLNDALRVRESRQWDMDYALQPATTVTQQLSEPVEPVRFQAETLGFWRKLRAKAQAHKLRGMQGVLHRRRQHRFQSFRVDSFHQRAVILQQACGEVAVLADCGSTH